MTVQPSSPADTGKAAFLNSYVSGPVRLTRTFMLKKVWIELIAAI